MTLEVKQLTPLQMILSFLMILLWIVVFTAGLLINSGPYRNIISEQPTATSTTASLVGAGHTTADVLEAWVVVLTCYTPINLIFLCMIAGLLGALARIAILHPDPKPDETIPEDKTNPLLSGVFRGLFVYLLVVSGTLVINESPFTSPTQVQYARLAGVMSLTSFIMSYNPTTFLKFLAMGNKIPENLKKKD